MNLQIMKTEVTGKVKKLNNKMIYSITVILILFLAQKVSGQFAGGSGTIDDPFQVETLHQLQSIGTDVNNLNKHFIQVENIDATESQTWNDGAGFDPIGNESFKFNGSYNGNQKLIEHLFINRPAQDYVGLFGYCQLAYLNDIHILNADITGNEYSGILAGYFHSYEPDSYFLNNISTSGNISGMHYVGGICGKAAGSNLHNSHSSSIVVATWDYAGGLFGEFLNGIINNSSFDGSVAGYDNVGGISGSFRGEISQCFTSSEVDGRLRIGGLVGRNVSGISLIENSYATGNVNGSVGVGGLVGSCISNITVNDSYATGSITGNDAIGGLVGALEGNVTNCWASGTIYLSGPTGGGLIGNTGQGLIKNSYALGDVIFQGPEGFGNELGGLIGVLSGSLLNCYANGSIVNGGDNIGGLVGLADGNFKYIDNCFATGSIEGANNVGGLIGSRIGAAIFNINDCYTHGYVNGFNNVGGFVGLSNDMTFISHSYSTGMVAGTTNTGGFLGYNPGSLEHCYWDVEFSTQSEGVGFGFNDGLIGLNTDQMTGQSAFCNMIELDFFSLWMLSEEYPVLYYQDIDFLPIPDPFTTIWNAINPGISNTNQVLFPGNGEKYVIRWNDINDETINGKIVANSNVVIDFPTQGIYKIDAYCNLTSFSFNNSNVNTDARKLLSVENWGDIQWQTMRNMFNGSENLRITAEDVPDLGMVNSLEGMFRSAILFNDSIGHWATDNVTDMFETFKGATSFNQNISGWNVSSVNRFDGMFENASSFNSNLGVWDLSSATSMLNMLDNSGVDCLNYSLTLKNWSNKPVPNNINFGALGLYYGLHAVDFRQSLIEDRDWTINGDISSGIYCGVEIVTLPAHYIYGTNAVSGGEIIRNSGSLIQAKGVVWSNVPNPTLEDSFTVDGDGDNIYSSLLQDLSQGETYYVRAYATNEEGTAYGNEINFNTLAIGIPCPGSPTVTDIDGNVYNTVLIGDQCWMKENLQVTKYRDGSSIDYPGSDNEGWESNLTGAYSWYDNDISWKNLYGALYNWHAVTNVKGLCPNGWSVPKDVDWTDMINYTESTGNFGGKLKSTSTDPDPHPRWNSPNSGATDEYLLSAIPGGVRSFNGTYSHFGNIGYYWSSTENIPSDGFYRMFRHDQLEIYRYSEPKLDGMSVRCIKNVYTWTGDLDSDWENTGNWDEGKNPSEYDDAIIEDGVNDPVIDLSPETPAEVNSLTINPGAKLSIAANKAFTVNGQFINSGGSTALILDNGATILHNTENITGTIRRQITGSEQFHFIGSPVSGINWGDPFTTEQHDHIWVRQYNEGLGDWESIYAQDDAVPGKGYSIWLDESLNTVTANFEGSINVSDISPVLTNNGTTGNQQYDGWNLISNPFAAALDWDHADWNRSDLDGSVYTWDAASGNYVSWNGSAGSLTDGVLPVAQGFFVKANGPTPTLTIPAAARMHHAQDFYKEAVANVLELNVSTEQNTFTDATFILFNPMSSVDFDQAYDAYKLFGIAEAPQLYTKTGDITLSINTLPEIAETLSIEVGFEASTEGNYTISAENILDFELAEAVNIEDKHLNSIQNLKEQPSYTFFASGAENPDRFRISFGITDVTEHEQMPNPRIWYANEQLFVANPQAENGTLTIYDVSGKAINQLKLNGNAFESYKIDLTKGVYMISCLINKSSTHTKIVVAK